MDPGVQTRSAAVPNETTRTRRPRRSLDVGAAAPTDPAEQTGSSPLEPLLLSIPSTQHILGGVGRSSIYAWLADGSLEGVKLGKILRITLDSVKRKAASAPRAVIRLGRRDAA